MQDILKPRHAILVLLFLFAFLPFSNRAEANATGVYTPGVGVTSGCPSGFTCNRFTVSCSNISQDAQGVIADQRTTVQPKGMVIFFSGESGTSWWSQEGANISTSYLQSLKNQGYELVQIQWTNGWTMAPQGVSSGQVALACRPATVIKWVHDNMYSQLGIATPAAGKCGFCITGNSAGASQVAYSISNYGLDNIINAAIPTSGPPMADLSKGCLQVPGYEYDPAKVELIDSSYGFRGNNPGPCANRDSSFTNTWVANSNETGGITYNYPTTRVHIIDGGQDQDFIKNRANDYYQKLLQSGQSMVTLQTVAHMAHSIQQSSDGLAALVSAILAGGGGGGSGDSTLPAVSISLPIGGATVSGSTVTVSATASDNVAVVGVQFMDGNILLADDTTSPYSIVWNTTLASNGSHLLTAIARDAAGNTRTSTGVMVTVSNVVSPPLQPPPPGSGNGGTGTGNSGGSPSGNNNGTSNTSNGDGSTNNVPVPPILPPISSFNFTRDLRFGSRGDDVVALQNILIQKGYLGSESNTGYFGNLTKAALIQYQLSAGIVPAVGYFGSITRASLGSAIGAFPPSAGSSGAPTVFTRDLSFGSRGEDVIALQNILIQKGYLGSESNTGYFGNLTKAALIQYQLSAGITPAVGYFGRITRGSIQSQ